MPRDDASCYIVSSSTHQPVNGYARGVSTLRGLAIRLFHFTEAEVIAFNSAKIGIQLVVTHKN